MKLYKCHKTVYAAKITSIQQLGVFITLVLDDEKVTNMVIDEAFFTRHNPKTGDYIVQYEDGYISVSPPKPFEEGYSEVEDIENFCAAI